MDADEVQASGPAMKRIRDVGEDTGVASREEPPLKAAPVRWNKLASKQSIP